MNTIEIGIQLADHCNLNCKGCLHFCYKSKKPYFYSVENYYNDLKRLKSFFDITTVRLYGGEPFLHPKLGDFINFTRCELPYAKICILSNGILIPSLPTEILDLIHITNTTICWSLYPIMTDSQINKICNLLKEHKVDVEINKIDTFYSCFRPEGDISPSFAFERCNGRNCHVMQDGKISVCPASLVAKNLEYFNIKCDMSDGLLDIYAPDLTTEKIIDFFSSPHSACRYCAAPSYYSWEQQNEVSDLNDWISKNR